MIPDQNSGDGDDDEDFITEEDAFSQLICSTDEFVENDVDVSQVLGNNLSFV